MSRYATPFYPVDPDDASDPAFWASVFEQAADQDHFEAAADDNRLDLAEYYGIAAAERRELEN